MHKDTDTQRPVDHAYWPALYGWGLRVPVSFYCRQEWGKRGFAGNGGAFFRRVPVSSHFRSPPSSGRAVAGKRKAGETPRWAVG